MPNPLFRLRRYGRFLKPAVRAARTARARLPKAAIARARRLHPPVRRTVLAARAAGLIEYREVYAAEPFERQIPQTVSQPLPWIYGRDARCETEAVGVFRFADARYWHSADGAVIDAKNRLIEEFTRCWWGVSRHDALVAWGLPQPRRLEGTTAILTAFDANDNYGHWLFDLVPKLHVLERCGLGPDKVDQYIVNHAGKRWQLDHLVSAGIDLGKVVAPRRGEHFALETALVPTARRRHEIIPRWIVDYLRAKDAKDLARSATDRMLFCPRAGERFRKLTNEDDVFSLLEPLGFELFDPGQHSPSEQRRAFSEARAIVGPHGSAFANVVYGAPGAVYVEIASPRFVSLPFYALASHVGMQCGLVVGDRPYPPVGQDPNERAVDFRVEPLRVLELVRKMLRDQEESASNLSSG